MKEDQLFIVLFIALLAILMLGLIPRAPTSDISGASISTLAASDSTGAAVSPVSGGEMIAVVIIIVAAVVGILFFFLKKSQASFKKLVSESPVEIEQPRLPIEKPKTHNHALHNYVQHSIAQGKSSSQVRHALLAVGWPKEAIEKVMQKL